MRLKCSVRVKGMARRATVALLLLAACALGACGGGTNKPDVDAQMRWARARVHELARSGVADAKVRSIAVGYNRAAVYSLLGQPYDVDHRDADPVLDLKAEDCAYWRSKDRPGVSWEVCFDGRTQRVNARPDTF